ncbi:MULTISPECIES: hypothetical protein [unclassified Rhizobium]|uniref:anti-sigma factor family protein n=1 Tax=unclassified Rhizobium TaxID=2613769 RepID=UPI001FCDC05F|nr:MULTISPECIES: hypothetical protein [unclassified Rhizobium]
MAFADGELDEATSARLEAALATDETLAERLAVFFESRLLVAGAMKPLIDEPVPEALLKSVRRMADDARSGETNAGNIVSLRPKPQRETRRWLMPLAASIVAVITGVVGFTVGRNLDPATLDSSAEIATVLDREASGQDIALGAGETLHVIASFRDKNGSLCREYELKQASSSTVSIACRQDQTWVTQLALSSAKAEGYVPASAQETIDAYLASIEAGAPLSPEEERAILAP